MAEFPKFPLWTDAYLGDTTHLRTVEHGAYLLLLIAMWRTPDKRLPNDDRMLARYARMSDREWQAVKLVLMPFFRAEGDTITQGRLRDEAELAQEYASKQSRRAKSRWLKNKELDDATADAAAVPDESRGNASLTLSLTQEGRDAKASLAPPAARVTDFQTFWDAYPHRDGVKRARAKVEAKYRAAVKSGVPEQAFLDAVARLKADKRVKDGFARDPLTWINQRGWEDEAPAAPSDDAKLSAFRKRLQCGLALYPDMMTAADTEALIASGDLTREEAARRNYPLAAEPIRRTG